MKKDKQVLAKIDRSLLRIKETIDLLGEDKRDELLYYLLNKKNKQMDTTVVYKLNVETERMLAVGQVDFHVGEEDYVVNLFCNPESQYKSLPSLKNAKAYYPAWFIEDSNKGFIEIYPSNRIPEIFIPNEFDDFPIGVISEQLNVTLYSSYEKLIQNKYNK